MVNKVFGKSVFAALLGLSLLAGTALPALGRDRDDACRRQVQKAEQNLDKAIRKHGERSHQAEKRRQQLEEVRNRCHMGVRDHDRDRDRDHR